MSLNFAEFAISNLLAKIKASTHFWIHICISCVSPVVDAYINQKSLATCRENLSCHCEMLFHSVQIFINYG